jgi:phospholipase C
MVPALLLAGFMLKAAPQSGDAAGQLGAALMAQPGTGMQQIQHVVVIFQENRTPDNLFHGLPNADIANSGKNSKGQIIPLTPVRLADYYDMGHSHFDFLVMYDGGLMDGADKIKQFCDPGHKCKKAPPNFQFKYVTTSDVTPYFSMAEQYTFADRMFQTNQGPSFPAHQFIISGTSAPTTTSDLFAAEGPSGTPLSGRHTGCTAPAKQRVALIDPTGQETIKVFPCFEHPTLADLLDLQQIDWRYYAPIGAGLSTGPNAIRHLRFGPDWTKNVVLHSAQVLTDIQNGQLAPVSWVMPNRLESDHPGGSDGSGPAWVASVVNAIGTSQYWSSTAIFITWDDWGGWYDHVAPPIYGSYQYGFRVPLIVVSPYAQPGYVSHVAHDFGSILKFTEEVFNLPSLGYADSRADDFSDSFNFHQAPLPFHKIPASHDANYFLHDKRPQDDPDND